MRQQDTTKIEYRDVKKMCLKTAITPVSDFAGHLEKMLLKLPKITSVICIAEGNKKKQYLIRYKFRSQSYDMKTFKIHFRNYADVLRKNYLGESRVRP